MWITNEPSVTPQRLQRLAMAVAQVPNILFARDTKYCADTTNFPASSKLCNMNADMRAKILSCCIHGRQVAGDFGAKLTMPTSYMFSL